MKIYLNNKLLAYILNHCEEQTAVPQLSKVLFLLKYLYNYGTTVALMANGK